MNIINLYDNYNLYFNSELKAIFSKISNIAQKNGLRIYLIGGMVRDLILNVKTQDIDITVEGDAIKFSEILESEADAKISSKHYDFGTAKILLDGQMIDLASTRSESYPKSGHLPHVDKIGCQLEYDVKRRDFTINSLALSLNSDNFAFLIDYVGGFKDLQNKQIRILHDKSFIDDPTRIIRALKYSTRLGFRLHPDTLRLQTEYLQKINYDMCYKRVKQELKKTFNQNLQIAFDNFIEQGLYKLMSDKEVNVAIKKYNIENLIYKYCPNNPWLVYFGIIALQIDTSCISFTKYENDAICDARKFYGKSFSDDLEIFNNFSKLKLETLLILCTTGHSGEVIRYLDKLRNLKIQISGKDLIKLGLTPSNKFIEIFNKVQQEKFKNPNLTKQEELEICKSVISHSCQ